MDYKFFSKNGEVLPIVEAYVPLSNIEYSYGFGVYETIRVMDGVPYFLEDHFERLAESARIISLEHSFSDAFIRESLLALIEKNQAGTCNIKMLLIGGRTKEEASIYILCLNPLFPDKKLYRDGVHCISYEYERMLPHAKTLNMLGSYLAYRKARAESAYESLLINRDGHLTEGTRTNFFAIRGKTLFSPPEKAVLLGVTRKAVLHVATKNGYELRETNMRLEDLTDYDGLFLTSTSSKILPIHSIDTRTFNTGAPALRELMRFFDAFLADCNGRLS